MNPDGTYLHDSTATDTSACHDVATAMVSFLRPKLPSMAQSYDYIPHSV
jgi:hypothetical protein